MGTLSLKLGKEDRRSVQTLVDVGCTCGDFARLMAGSTEPSSAGEGLVLPITVEEIITQYCPTPSFGIIRLDLEGFEAEAFDFARMALAVGESFSLALASVFWAMLQ